MENSIKQQAFLLAKIYLQTMRKYTFRIPNIEFIKKSKWFYYFEKTIEKYNKEKEWDAKAYVEFLFEHYDKVYPTQMLDENKWKDFVDNRFKYEQVNDDVIIAQYLLNDYKYIKNWFKKNNKEFNLKEFFEDKRTKFFLKRNIISPYTLSILKNFLEFYENLTLNEKIDIINPKDIIIKQMMVKKNKKIYNKLKEIYGILNVI